MVLFEKETELSSKGFKQWQPCSTLSLIKPGRADLVQVSQGSTSGHLGVQDEDTPTAPDTSMHTLTA